MLMVDKTIKKQRICKNNLECYRTQIYLFLIMLLFVNHILQMFGKAQQYLQLTRPSQINLIYIHILNLTWCNLQELSILAQALIGIQTQAK